MTDSPLSLFSLGCFSGSLEDRQDRRFNMRLWMSVAEWKSVLELLGLFTNHILSPYKPSTLYSLPLITNSYCLGIRDWFSSLLSLLCSQSGFSIKDSLGYWLWLFPLIYSLITFTSLSFDPGENLLIKLICFVLFFSLLCSSSSWFPVSSISFICLQISGKLL